MNHLIPLEKGTYIVERAFFAAPDGRAVRLEDAILEVYEDHRGKRQVKGRGFVYNFLLVKLLDDNDLLMLVLDLGGGYRYSMPDPEITAGKVFSRGVKSVLQFAPTSPWREMTDDDLDSLHGRLTFLSE